MMNYQYPTTYMLDNPEQLIKIAPTPPPMLPPLDPSEVEQTLYQRRVSDANGIDANIEALQPLQINYGSNNQYYQAKPSYSPPAQQRSAPVQNNNILPSNSSVLFSKTPRCDNTIDKSTVSVPKPPATPPPPLAVVDAANPKIPKLTNHNSSSNTTQGTGAVDIVAITPQSHANINSNSASNHSTTSNNTTATTIIESASHSSHSSHHSPPNNNNNNIIAMANKQQQQQQHQQQQQQQQQQAASNIISSVLSKNVVSVPKLPASTVPVPQLANPLPPNTNNHKHGVAGTEGIVIPMDQQNYNALLQQMYPNGMAMVHTTNTGYSAHPASFNPATSTQTASGRDGHATYPRHGTFVSQQQHTFNVHDDLNDICYNNNGTAQWPKDNVLTAPFNIYSTYDTNPYLYNTPPLPTNNGYYNGTTTATATANGATGSNYYAHQPNTAPSQHILQHNQYQHRHSTIPKSADIYGHNSYHQHQQQRYGSHHHHHQQQQQQQQVTSTYNNNNSNHYNNQQSPHSQQQCINIESHSNHFHQQQSPKQHGSSTGTVSNSSPKSHPDDNIQSENVEYLQRCDGTIISPNSDPLRVSILASNINNNNNNNNNNINDESDAFTAGDDALFGNNMVTIINVNWQTNIPFATVRMHISNRIHHVPLMDLHHINNGNLKNNNNNNNNNNRLKPVKNNNNNNNKGTVNNNNRYRLGINNNIETPSTDIGETVIRRNPKLSDETLMKLPHLRKHREYIRTIDVNMGPKDYNSYRVSVNSKNVQNSDDDNSDNNGRTANIQNLSAKSTQNNLNGNNNRKNKNKRMSACEKGDLFKTELCENWVKKGHCTYGKKCHFAHGRDDIRTRWRIENYKTQPCCDPARADSRLCLFGKRCNYAHPGEPLRRSHHCLYLDEEYQAEILKDYGQTTPYPFGIYI